MKARVVDALLLVIGIDMAPCRSSCYAGSLIQLIQMFTPTSTADEAVAATTDHIHELARSSASLSKSAEEASDVPTSGDGPKAAVAASGHLRDDEMTVSPLN